MTHRQRPGRRTRRSPLIPTLVAVALAAGGLTAVANSPASSDTANAASPASSDTEPMTSPPPLDSEPMGRPVEDMPPWQTAEIVDVDGEVFTLADYVGTPVIVETMATWCSNCRRQLADTNTAAEEVGDAAAVVALSVETDLTSEQLADYAATQGFDAIRFAVMTPELLGMIVDEFGNTSINPPATPKFILDAEGYATEMTTGLETVDELVDQLVEAGADLDGMDADDMDADDMDADDMDDMGDDSEPADG